MKLFRSMVYRLLRVRNDEKIVVRTQLEATWYTSKARQLYASYRAAVLILTLSSRPWYCSSSRRGILTRKMMPQTDVCAVSRINCKSIITTKNVISTTPSVHQSSRFFIRDAWRYEYLVQVLWSTDDCKLNRR